MLVYLLTTATSILSALHFLKIVFLMFSCRYVAFYKRKYRIFPPFMCSTVYLDAPLDGASSFFGSYNGYFFINSWRKYTNWRKNPKSQPSNVSFGSDLNIASDWGIREFDAVLIKLKRWKKISPFHSTDTSVVTQDWLWRHRPKRKPNGGRWRSHLHLYYSNGSVDADSSSGGSGWV